MAAVCSEVNIGQYNNFDWSFRHLIILARLLKQLQKVRNNKPLRIKYQHSESGFASFNFNTKLPLQCKETVNRSLRNYNKIPSNSGSAEIS